jgi:ATP-dependent RNA helicase DeaD
VGAWRAEPQSEYMATESIEKPGGGEDIEARAAFQDLNLRKELLESLGAMGFERAMPVQERVLTEGMGRDLIVQARTGSGKTVAYGCAIFQTIPAGHRGAIMLTICPTRELAYQVAQELETLGVHLDLHTAVLTGGANFAAQQQQLQGGAAVVVGTPGRILHHLNERTLRSSGITAVVLDEADRLLDMGFRDDLETILSHFKHRERTILCSATMPSSVTFLAEKHTDNALGMELDGGNQAHVDIAHKVFVIPGTERFNAFRNLVLFHEPERAIIFGSTRIETGALHDRMRQAGFEAGLLSGDMPQKKRDRTMERFRKGHLRFLVATDVAARGIDVQEVTHVFHYRISQDAETYVHRSGRTGRADRQGLSIAVITPSEVLELEKLIRPLPLHFEVELVPEVESFSDPEAARAKGAVGGLRKAIALERQMAERQYPGTNRVFDGWMKEGASGTYVPDPETPASTDSPEKQAAKRWTGPIIDLRTRGGGKKRGGPRRR